MYKLDKHPLFVKFVHLPCHMMGVCQVCTSTLWHDGCLSSLYIYLVTWWAFVKFVHLPVQTWQTPIMRQGRCTNLTNTHHVTRQMYKLDKHPSCDKVDVQTWQTPIMWQGRCLSSLYICLVTWWVFVKFVHLPCHMMDVCQVCTSTLSHDGCLSSLYIYLVTWWVFVKFVHLTR
jgi:predicted secreted protein